MTANSHAKRGIRKGLGVALGAMCLSTSFAGTAQADWTKDVLDARCEEARREQMGDAMRDNIEASVRRAEASIQAPTPIGDLSCLNDLMTLPLDTFSQIGGLLSSLTAGLQDGISGISGNLDFDVAGAICGMAADKWASLTPGLGASALSFADFGSMASNPSERLKSGITAKTLAFNGQSSSVDRNGYSGSIGNYTPPNTDRSEEMADIPVFPDYEDRVYDGSAAQAAEDEAWAKNMTELASYIGCRVATNMDGAVQRGQNSFSSTTLSTNPVTEDCVFRMTGTPVVVNSNPGSPRFNMPRTLSSDEVQHGQSRAAVPSVQNSPATSGTNGSAPAVTPPERKSTGNPIWDNLTN